MQENKRSLSEALISSDILSITWEMIPGRGAFEKSQENVLKMAELAAKDKRINGITITDSPGGRPAMLPLSLAVDIKNMGIDPLIHFTCKDKNRNSIQSDLYALERAGLTNLLVMTGDYPTEGYTGCPKPVFDMDAVQTIKLIESMNKGERVQTLKSMTTIKPTNFFAGAVVSPFKKTEQEQVTQYYKLFKKIKCGAKFIITQVGYDPRKYEELRIYMDMNDIKVPLVGNVFLLPAAVAKLMNENKIPGCVVTDEMLWTIQDERGKFSNPKDAQLLRSAKLYAVLKGLKYDGINIGGHGLKYSDVDYIIEKGEELSKNWQEIAEEFQALHNEGFYFFEKDVNTGLNTDKQIDLSKTGTKKTYLDFIFFDTIHALFFADHAPFLSFAKLAIKLIDNSYFKGLFTWFEHIVKFFSNECRFCGDCAMVERAYVCPMSQCPKQQRNGPCGGSYEGWCEVYPDEQKCIYVLAYDRLKTKNKQLKLKLDYIPPCNWDLYKTASWLNNLTGRDFTCSKEYIKDLSKKGTKNSTLDKKETKIELESCISTKNYQRG